MGNIFDYLTWRGDLTFTQDPPNAVDALIFSTLAYVSYGPLAQCLPGQAVSLRQCAGEFFTLPDRESRVRVKRDMELLDRAAMKRMKITILVLNFFMKMTDGLSICVVKH